MSEPDSSEEQNASAEADGGDAEQSTEVRGAGIGGAPELELHEDPDAPYVRKSKAKRDGPPALVDELGVEDLHRTYILKHGREFAAAGREIPVAEIDSNGLIMHNPDAPLSARGESEIIAVQCDEHGIVLNELGDRRKVAGARYHGNDLYWHKDTVPDTTRHYVAWYDSEWNAHGLYMEQTRLNVDIILKMRARTLNGELSIFPDLRTEKL